MNPETDLQADYKSCKSEETYLYCVADYDSVEHKHLDGVNEVKMEKPTMGEIKSEEPEPELINMEMENTVLNDEFCIKSEYDEDAIADLKWDRIKVEQKFDPGIEAVLIADTADQIKMEFQESEKVEEKLLLRSVNSENVDALGLNEEIHIKTEFDQTYVIDSACDSAQIEKMREKEQENPQIEEGKQFVLNVKKYLLFSFSYSN
ncbi:unnamed protein product [Acanthoscelides obtectus]|uniref:Uncharacterized protein n=1 Tax=Acanthoscelides obtectus TaxID=200917 RepID=A0A9P0KSK4_ACAOB|nr:unnamed protein product [Acanthoscelides obtectus]CAK1675776.1 hypothetical protein AOBTE_LOCUS30424 [Acanthoscelides obtectus]